MLSDVKVCTYLNQLWVWLLSQLNHQEPQNSKRLYQNSKDKIQHLQLLLINNHKKSLLVVWVNFIYKFILKEWKENLEFKSRSEHQVLIIEKLLLKRQTSIIYIRNSQEVLVNMLVLWVILNRLILNSEKQNVNLWVRLLVLLFHLNILQLYKKHSYN